MRHSFVSLLSASGVQIEHISKLIGHKNTIVTETVYRRELRPVLTERAEAMDQILPPPGLYNPIVSHSVSHPAATRQFRGQTRMSANLAPELRFCRVEKPGAYYNTRMQVRELKALLARLPRSDFDHNGVNLPRRTAVARIRNGKAVIIEPEAA